MTINPYINLYDATNEQSLVESLIVESIKFYGMDVIYIKRAGTTDTVFQEQEQSEFNTAFPIEMYIKSVDGYGGDGQFLSNFGIEVRHQALFTVAQSRWRAEAATASVTDERPQEGDLIYFRKDHKLLEIKRVNQYELFYQLGALQSWDLTLEVFEYSSEKFNTGYPEIDAIEQTNSLSTREHGSAVNGLPAFDPGFELGGDEFSDNEGIEDDSGGLIDFSEDNPFSESF